MGTGGCFYAPELLSSLSQESRALPQTFCPRRACGSGRKGGRRRPACAVPARPPSGRLPPLSGCPPGPVPADFYVAKAQKARLLLVASNKRATRKWLAITRQHNSPATRQRAAGEFSQQLELAGWPGDPFRMVLARTVGEVGVGHGAQLNSTLWRTPPRRCRQHLKPNVPLRLAFALLHCRDPFFWVCP